ncbi:MAG: glycerate kinase [Verrucomicrobia bacterium]|nr:MAG: glycerate kinase [Verrucomicrobiota bacterium]
MRNPQCGPVPRRILVAPDKFKGTLTAREAAESIAAGWRRIHPDDVLDLLPMSDGGEGFGAVLAGALDAETRVCPTTDAAGRPRDAQWWWSPARGVAVVETAQVNGLALLPPGRFHPFELDTFGIGAVLRDAVAVGARECWIGVGGSATNDAGFGLARSLGWRFFDGAGLGIERWPDLARLARIQMPPTNPLEGCALTVAVDVGNPLLGPDGCTRVYGPQKGLNPDRAPEAEAALGRLAETMRAQWGRDLADVPGSGAAGGLGYGLQAFLGARVESGFEIFSKANALDSRLGKADLVLTGEGSLDRQSLMGKGTGRIAARARIHGKPCIGLAGLVEPLSAEEAGRSPFAAAHAIAPTLATPEAARARAAHWLEELAARVARG